MAHFARLDSNNTVVDMMVVSNTDVVGFNGELETEEHGIAFCREHWKNSGGEDNTNWKQTFISDKNRGNYAGIGHIYMENVRTLGVASTDIFITPQPYPSWSIGIHTALWYAPDPPGEPPETTHEEKLERKFYQWSEDRYNADPSTGWKLVQISADFGNEVLSE